MNSNNLLKNRVYSQNNKGYGKTDFQQPNKNIFYRKYYERRIINNHLNQNPLKVSNYKENNSQNKASNDYKEIITTNNNIKRNDIICPECGEHVLINIKDYKITLCGCKNNHKTENILLNEFLETQKKGLSNIKCDCCLVNNKNNIKNNEFYRCIECKLNICPECKIKHHKKHKIVNHEYKYYICKKHYYTYRYFCKACRRNICFTCKNEHTGHDMPYFYILLT